jgi:hypothetical protein
MAGTFTSRLRLYKPAADGSDNVNVVTDLNNNLDRLDAIVSFVPVTLATYPASGYHGQAFYETDTGKAYLNVSASASTITKSQVLVAGASFDSNITMTASARQVIIGGSSSTAAFTARRASFGDILVSGQVASASAAGSTWYTTVDGVMNWGSGASAVDVSLYRDAAGVLGIGGGLIVDDDVIVGDTLYTDNAELTGDLTLSGGVYRNNTSAVTTVANTTTESVVAAWTIPANDAAPGATYRLKAWGTLGVTGTPTMTFRTRLGGAAGAQMGTFPAVTVRSGATDGYWFVELTVVCQSTGAAGTWSPLSEVGHNFVTSATTYARMGPICAAPLTRDTTAATDMVVTAQWSAASSSNTITCRGFTAERVGG